jgi:hypothetical protein
MNAVAKSEIESQVIDRLGHVFARHERRPLEILSSGISEIDQALGGLPRGAITEIHGAASSGRTSFMLATLAAASANDETCAVIDCSDTFDLLSAAKAGVRFDGLLWVRCHNDLEHAFKSVDLLLHGGGFGFVVLSLADMPARSLRRIISTWWFRFRRAIENTPTVLLVLTPVACARSCAAMALELKHEAAVWAATDSLVTRDDNHAPLVEESSAKHLSLVFAGDRNAPHYSLLPNHARLLRATIVRAHRQRPVEWSNQLMRFTPGQ